MKPSRILMVGMWALAVACIGGYVAATTLTGDSEPEAPAVAPSDELPRLFEFAEFDLVSHRDEPFSSENVDGKPWVGFIFLVNCPTGACPVMVDKMNDLQSAIPDEEVQFVSFSVDPDRDTAESMSQFVEAVTGDQPGDRWHLLTGGTREGMSEFARQNRLAVGEDWGHSTQFLLIDADGVVRGVYGNSNPLAMTELAADARRLVAAGGR
ncbi:MAG: SCO family protein [Planctomycetota bacterium]